MPDRPHRNFYGRLKGKHLKESQKGYLDTDLDALSPGPVGWTENPERHPLDLRDAFGDKEIWLEIGFGGGEHLLHQAASNPGVGIIGAEPYLNGVAMLLGKLRPSGCDNVRIHPGDVRDLLDVLPHASVSKSFLLYPDPWPKARHHRRRFVTPEHLVPLASAMKPEAELRIATDIPDYVRQALEEVPRCGFSLAADTDAPWQDWTRTRYEAKAIGAGRAPHYLTFVRS